MTKKHKHLTLEDRCYIHEHLNLGDSFTAIGKIIDKDRTTVAKEVQAHRILRESKNKLDTECARLSRPPYVCNPCPYRRSCRKTQYLYDAVLANDEYRKMLSEERSDPRIPKAKIAEINEMISPLMRHKHHSVNHVYLAHLECLPISKSTFYRYIDRGLFDVRNIDLQRKVRFRVKKKAKDIERNNMETERKFHRFYTDFQRYLELHPTASIVEMDTVIGTKGGNGGKCFLTLLFRQFKLMLVYLLPYNRTEYVTDVFRQIKTTLGEAEFSRLFEIILTDNGSEFSDPDSIEASLETGEKLINVFYCDPMASWQKGTLEKNHEYIRYVLPKGTSFARLTQDDCNLLASNINSVPRRSLNDQSPYEAAVGFIGRDNLDALQIKQIPNDDIDLSSELLRK